MAAPDIQAESRALAGSRLAVWSRRAYGVVLMLVGAAMLAGGALLVLEGGSFFYLLVGMALCACGVLAWRADRRAAWLYGVMLVATIAWSVYEVGFNGWGLLPRLAAHLALGIPMLWLRAGIAPGRSTPRPWFAGWAGAGGSTVAAVLFGAVLHGIGPAQRVDPLLERGLAAGAPAAAAAHALADARGDWPHYGNDRGGTRFSPLTQISAANVDKLELAWEADVGPAAPGPKSSLQVTPINIGDSLYVCNGHNMVIALDAETGRDRWRFDMTRDTPPSGKPCRGVSYYRVPEATGVCADRILAISQTPELFALDARTGIPCPGFGVEGRVRLLDGLGEVPPGYHYVSSAPQMVRGKAVLGGAIMDGQYWGEPSGVIRAFDAVTGQLAWAFDVGRPTDHAAPAEGQSYTPATPNSWAPISADETLGLVYLPMGNATPDFYGPQRRPFDDQVSSSVVALDAETGEMRWRFQTVHRDVWDYDVPSQPTLVDLPTSGGIRRALIQPTKRGEVFVLDRETGEPIKAVDELPVPRSAALPGERLSRTQPFSTAMPSLRGPTLSEADMWGLTPIDQMMCRILFRRARHEGTLTPVTLDRPTILDPGYSGGVNWGSASVDVDRSIMLVNWMRLPSLVEVYTRDEANALGVRRFDGRTGQGGGRQPMENTPYAARPGAFLSPLGMPCSAPPWALLTAVDLAEGQVIWSQALGDGRESGPFGLRSRLPITMGVPSSGGTMTTRGGLVFIGATVDSMFRAFNVASGEKLWETSLPGAGMATPMTYRSAGTGRQFVVIAAGGRPNLQTRTSTKIVAYALPR